MPREDYQRLLLTLDPDPIRAAKEYEKLRQKLIVFFDRNGFPDAYIQADEALDRTARGVGIENINAYAHEVARRQLLENIRDRDRNPVKADDFDDVLRTREAHIAVPSTSFGVPDEKVIAEIRMQCLDLCMKRLPREDRRLLLAWYREEGRVKLELRQQLARDRGISMAALKTRLFRLRQGLAGCCADCIEKALAARQRF
jgi:DNA-directed RNA polymerase specialized sigma24 family protein